MATANELGASSSVELVYDLTSCIHQKDDPLNYPKDSSRTDTR